MIRNLLVASAFVALTCVAAAPVSAQFGQGNSANNLFSQYATADGPSTTTAGMYPAPHYVPPMGAQSYYTYQPLMPHEMMYQHSRNYYNYYNTGGYMGGYDSLNKTKVRWQSGTNHIGPLPFSSSAAGLNYRFHKRFYDLDGGSRHGSRGCSGGNCGSRVRGRLHGKVGCASGDCGGEVYGGETYGGEVYSDSYGGGCASGSCASNPAGTSVRR